MTDRPLPVALDAERYVIGSLLAGNVTHDTVAAALEVGDFGLERHRLIYRAIGGLYDRGEAVNTITVYEELGRRKAIEEVGGLSVLTGFDADAPLNVDSYLRLVKDKSILRQAIQALKSNMDRCFAAQDDASEIVSDAERMLSSIGESAPTKVRLKTPEEVKMGYPGGANAFFYPEKQTDAIPSPWQQLNDVIIGFRPGELIILGARPGVGKSAAAAQIAHYAAVLGYGTALFSLEMGDAEILTRMTCARASIDGHKFKRGFLSREERERFQLASGEIDRFPIWIDDSTGCSVPAMHSALRKKMSQGKIGLVVVDYLQLMDSAGKQDKRVEEVSAITRGLKKMAREFRVPVLALSQLSRASVGNDPPQLHHLRESGSIEQDANIVIFLHAPDAPPNQMVIPVQVIVAKHRGGPVGAFYLDYVRPFTRFDDPRQIQDREVA